MVVDLIDTWGRGYIDSHTSNTHTIISVRMGGGILRPVATTTDLRYMNSSWEWYNLCHWEKSAPFQETQPTADINFTAAYILVIGAFSVNPDCHFDETKSFFTSGPFLQELNV
jgi:hypothetical protein